MYEKYETTECPECGGLASGILEKIEAWTYIFTTEDGYAEFLGETDVDWNSQKPILDSEGKVTLRCDSGHTWLSTVLEEG